MGGLSIILLNFSGTREKFASDNGDQWNENTSKYMETLHKSRVRNYGERNVDQVQFISTVFTIHGETGKEENGYIVFFIARLKHTEKGRILSCSWQCFDSRKYRSDWSNLSHVNSEKNHELKPFIVKMMIRFCKQYMGIVNLNEISDVAASSNGIELKYISLSRDANNNIKGDATLRSLVCYCKCVTWLLSTTTDTFASYTSHFEQVYVHIAKEMKYFLMRLYVLMNEKYNSDSYQEAVVQQVESHSKNMSGQKVSQRVPQEVSKFDLKNIEQKSILDEVNSKITG